MGETLENHAARILQAVRPGVAADAVLREYLTGRKTLGAVGRRSVSKAVFAYYRWLRWLAPSDSLQKQVLAAQDLQAKFDRDPAAIKVEALAARAVPSWLGQEVDLSAAYLRQLQREPALWIRVASDRAAAVAKAVGHCAPPILPAGFPAPAKLAAYRYVGTADLHLHPEFKQGHFEIQDLASQLVGHACAPQPGETWWDACAGEGGKTLHLSDLMGNKGLLWATDRSARRLATLKKRAARAGMFNYRSAEWTGVTPAPFKTKCDGVLVDAPCSGVGTWQRNPHARWTTRIEDVTELAGVQDVLLARAAGSVKVGGRLIFAICTLTRREATVADRFQAAHPEFEPWPIPLGSGTDSRIFLLPQDLNANGMFIAAWKRVR